MRRPLLPLVTRDPVTGDELIVTRLESPATGLILEGRFSLGWVGRLSREQIEFVGLLLRSRNNLQKVATDLGVAYNTARARLDEIVDALGEQPAPSGGSSERREVLDRLAAGEISYEEALAAIERMR